MDELKPLYTVKEAEDCLKHFKPVPYLSEFYINDEISFHYSDVGHIIGAAAIHITSHEIDKQVRLTFTGDVGRYNDMILKAPESFQQSNYIICESTYGDSLHESPENSEQKLLEIIQETCLVKKGKLIIPAFSLGRTQEIVYILNNLKNKGLLPPIKVFVDSPLSSKATRVMRKHPECFNTSIRESMLKDPDPFEFESLKYIEDAKDSKLLNEVQEPCILISASGMGDAGRVKHHIRYAIGNAKNTILIAGYCSPHTLGAELLSGSKKVHIFGDYFDVLADVVSIQSLSAHADYGDLLRYLSCQNKIQLKQLFLVHGEETSKTEFKSKLLQEGYHEVIIPKKGESFHLA